MDGRQAETQEESETESEEEIYLDGESWVKTKTPDYSNVECRRACAEFSDWVYVINTDDYEKEMIIQVVEEQKEYEEKVARGEIKHVCSVSYHEEDFLGL